MAYQDAVRLGTSSLIKAVCAEDQAPFHAGSLVGSSMSVSPYAACLKLPFLLGPHGRTELVNDWPNP